MLYMLNVGLIICFLGGWMSAPVDAAVLTFEETAEAFIGDNQTKNDARHLAILEAKRRALEKTGVYLESLTVVQNSQLQRDDILVLTAGITQTTILKEEPLISESSFGIRVTAQVTVDPSILPERIREFRQSQNWREAYQELLKQNRVLETNLKNLKNQATSPDMQAQYQALQDYAESLRAYDNQDWAAAVNKATTAIAQWPTLAIAYNNRARALVQLKKNDDAIQDYRQAITLTPTYLSPYLNLSLLYSQNRATFEQALQLCEQARQHHLSHPRIAEMEAYVYTQTNRWEDALRVYDQAIAQAPLNIELYFNRATVKQALSLWNQALADYSHVLQNDPHHTKALNNRGALLLQQGKPQEALSDYNQLLTLQPLYANGYYNRGLAYHALQQCSRAQPDYAKACQLGLTLACRVHCP